MPSNYFQGNKTPTMSLKEQGIAERIVNNWKQSFGAVEIIY